MSLKVNPSPPNNRGDEIWTMIDGTEIAVNDMSEAHVRNALRMIIRNDRLRKEREFKKIMLAVEVEEFDFHDAKRDW